MAKKPTGTKAAPKAKGGRKAAAKGGKAAKGGANASA